MWKVATALGPSGMSTAAQAATPAADKVLPYARWASLGTCIAYLILGGLAIGIEIAFIVGPICVCFGVFVAIMEYPFVPIAKFSVFHIFCNYYYKAILYLCFCVPAFFNTFTILCGIASIGCAGVWAFCGFKGAKGTPVTAKPTEQQLKEEEEARGHHDPHAQDPNAPPQQKRKSFFGFGGEPEAAPAPAPVVSEEAPAGKSRKSKFPLAAQGAHPGKG